MAELASQLPQTRGTIIVDANILYDLKAPVPEAYKDQGKNPIKYFWEILPFLAGKNYKIIIPEYVSYETGDVICRGADGKDRDINTYFAHPDVNKRTDIVDDPHMRGFLLKVARGEYPGIEMAPTTAPPVAAELMQGVHEVFDTYKAESRQAAEKLIDIGSMKKSAKKQGVNLGEKVIGALLDQMAAGGNTSPVFVLSDDRDAIEMLAEKHLNVAYANINRFMKSICMWHLHTELGLKYHTSSDDLNAVMSAYNKGALPIRSNIDHLGHEFLNYVAGREHANPRVYPFQGAMRKLAVDLGTHQDRQEHKEPPRPTWMDDLSRTMDEGSKGRDL